MLVEGDPLRRVAVLFPLVVIQAMDVIRMRLTMNLMLLSDFSSYSTCNSAGYFHNCRSSLTAFKIRQAIDLGEDECIGLLRLC